MTKKAKVRIAINGFGRIGRAAFKIALTKKNIEIVAINDLTAVDNLAYLLKYDSAYGRFDHRIAASKQHLVVDEMRTPVFAERDPSKLPWKRLRVDVVLECTGFFKKRDDAGLHLKAGARAVVISAPTSSPDVPTVLIGVNDRQRSVRSEPIISNASCTTNSIAPVIGVMHHAFGVQKAIMSTIHAVTSSQGLVDRPDPKDFRRGRAASFNIVPTSTGAAVATTKAIPELGGRFDGIAIRVPVITGSLSDITMLLAERVTVDRVNDVFKKAATQASLKGVLEVTEDPIVSSDVIGTSASSIVDLSMTRVVDGDLVKVVAWYDNEWGYTHRLVEQALRIAPSL